jgi:hypothetical protein
VSAHQREYTAAKRELLCGSTPRLPVTNQRLFVRAVFQNVDERVVFVDEPLRFRRCSIIFSPTRAVPFFDPELLPCLDGTQDDARALRVSQDVLLSLSSA